MIREKSVFSLWESNEILRGKIDGNGDERFGFEDFVHVRKVFEVCTERKRNVGINVERKRW